MSIIRIIKNKKSKDNDVFFEQDNKGKRADTLPLANKYFDEQCSNPLALPPFTLFLFNDKRKAVKAMLKLPYIHKAKDSGKLISDIPITYGIYRVPYERWFVAFVLGFHLSLELFERTEKVFSKHGACRNHNLPDGAKERYRVKYCRLTKQWITWD